MGQGRRRGGDGEEPEAARLLTGSYPAFRRHGRIVADILVGMQLEGLPTSYVNDRNDYIEAVTLDEIKRVAARLMKPEDLRFVGGGQAGGADGD